MFPLLIVFYLILFVQETRSSDEGRILRISVSKEDQPTPKALSSGQYSIQFWIGFKERPKAGSILSRRETNLDYPDDDCLHCIIE